MPAGSGTGAPRIIDPRALPVSVASKITQANSPTAVKKLIFTHHKRAFVSFLGYLMTAATSEFHYSRREAGYVRPRLSNIFANCRNDSKDNSVESNTS